MGAVCSCLKPPQEPEVDRDNSNQQGHCFSCCTNFVSKFTALFKNNKTAETQHSQDLEAETEVPKSPTEEEQECPICLEEYTKENPRIMMKCFHIYHLSCIYEWLERSNLCPVCNRLKEPDIFFKKVFDEEKEMEGKRGVEGL
ncbi:hypothetical protein TIFTF001_011263 [Ficus carica]|uniref:RING-type E3 ubiquitin transferase n=1 Tax=Ficus carica TaxID=3494 RepID=A0AA88D2P8_FICCA|nr:hypothetical protein TIFTF001_011263 [Ficus carica]